MRRFLGSVGELAVAVVSLADALIELAAKSPDPMVRGPLLRAVVGQVAKGLRTAGKEVEQAAGEVSCCVLGLTDWLGWTSLEDKRWSN